MNHSKRRLSKGIPLMALLLLVVGAFSASAAQADAPSWTVGGTGTFLGTGTTKNLEWSNSTPMNLWVPAVNGQMISCEASSLGASSKIVGNASSNGSGTAKEVVINYTGCTLPTFPKCTVRSTNPSKPAGSITTNKLKGTLVWLGATGNSEGLLLEAETGANLTTTSFEGEECVFSEIPKALTGSLVGKVEPEAGKPEQETAKIAFPLAQITKYWKGGEKRVETGGVGLRWGGIPASYLGNEVGKLTEAGVHPLWGVKAH